MSIALAHAGPSILAAFLASFVEFIEALTVILAVGSVRGWPGAFAGSGVALLILLAIVAVLGSALARIPLDAIRLAVGTLTLLFGMRWLCKAILRSARVIPLHDESVAFANETEAMRRRGKAGQRWDGAAFAAAFQITMLEGTEVVFIVIAIGAGGAGLLVPAGLGALAALLLVIVLGAAVHRPIASIPENTLKFAVGVLLSAFGSFWTGEGIGLEWPGVDWSILGLVVGFLIVALAAVPLSRARASRPPKAAPATQVGEMRWLKAILTEIYGLFVDDGRLAIAIMIWLGMAWLLLPRIELPSGAKGPILFAGLALVLAESALRRARDERTR